MLLVRVVSTSCPACGGMTTVKALPPLRVPVLLPPTDPAICRLCTCFADTSFRNCEEVRLVDGDRVGSAKNKMKMARIVIGHSQLRQDGGGGGADPVGLSPGGGGFVCLLMGLLTHGGSL